MEWTFDPLEIKNAYFNIERLGAIVRRFVLNQYGTTSSASAWRTADRSLHRGVVDCEPARRSDSRRPRAGAGRSKRIAVPAAIDEIKAGDPAQAREIQKRVSARVPGKFRRKGWR